MADTIDIIADNMEKEFGDKVKITFWRIVLVIFISALLLFLGFIIWHLSNNNT